MAKCPMCNSKKGKRVCKLVENQKVCSLCCGTTRNSECIGCEHYKSPLESRKYTIVPKYSPQDMEASFSLQGYSNDIETVLCNIDKEHNLELKDDVALSIYKLLMDKYYFKDSEFIGRVYISIGQSNDVFNQLVFMSLFDIVWHIVIPIPLTLEIYFCIFPLGY